MQRAYYATGIGCHRRKCTSTKKGTLYRCTDFRVLGRRFVIWRQLLKRIIRISTVTTIGLTRVGFCEYGRSTPYVLCFRATTIGVNV